MFDLKITYGFTTHGNVKEKLEYVFNLYDLDNNGYIEKDEVKPVLQGMFRLLGITKVL
jgi:Ca2+-binding EF-hand superfamily protein